MQNSIVSLDTAVDEVMSTEQDQAPTDLVRVEMTDASTNSAQPKKAEAEVKLVVRFIVEEHIIYNGEIQRVNHLESEELSRIVSKVEWNEEETIKAKAIKVDQKNSNHACTSTQTDEVDMISRSTSPTDLSPEPQHGSDTSGKSHNVVGSEVQSPIAPPSFDTSKMNNDSQCASSIIAQLVNDQKADKIEYDCDIDNEQLELQCTSGLIPSSLQKSSESQLAGSIESPKPGETNSTDVDHGEDCYSIASPSVGIALRDCLDRVDQVLRQEDSGPTEIVVDNSNETPKIETKRSPKEITTDTKCAITRTAEDSSNKQPLPTDNHIQTDNQTRQIDDANHCCADSNTGGPKGSPSATHNTIISDDCFSVNGENSTSTTKKKMNSSTGKRIRKNSGKESRASNPKATTNRPVDVVVTKRRQDTSRNGNQASNTNQMPTQHKIFAKWSDNHFYPGTIIRLNKDRKFVVSFFDGAQRNVSETDIVPLCNITGKQVRVSIAKNYCVNAIVHDQQSSVNEQPMFDVEYQQDGLVRKCVPMKDIFLTGEQGTPLINQVDKNSGASNFADVDLDNIIYEKRSRRLQELEDFDMTDNFVSGNKRKRGQYQTRNTTPKFKGSPQMSEHTEDSGVGNSSKQTPNYAASEHDAADSPGAKSNLTCPDSNNPSECSNSTGSSSVPHVLDLGQEFYFSSTSPHRTKTSLLL